MTPVQRELADLGDRGLTLAELLVALALLGVLAAFWAGALGAGTAVWSNSVAGARSMEEVLRAQDILRDLLAKAIPPAEGEAATFSGRPDEVRILVVPPDALGGYRPERFVMRLEARDGGSSLMLEREGRASITLMEGLHEAAFGYWNGGGRWQERWEGRGLPAIIRITGSFAKSDVRVWPDFLVRTRLTAPPLCDFDPVSRSCRAREGS